MFKRRLIPIFLVLALTITLGLVAFSCNGTEGEEPSNIFWPTLTKVKIIPETNGHNGDEDSPVCLEKVGGEVEKFTLEITISNPDRWPILSFNYNDLTYTSEVFGAESNHQVVYLEKLSAPEGGLMMIYGLYPGTSLENAEVVANALEKYAGLH